MRTVFVRALAFAAFIAFVHLPAAAEGEARPKAAPAKAGPPVSQQDRMRKCNADAKQKSLKGDERRAFMSRCLKG